MQVIFEAYRHIEMLVCFLVGLFIYKILADYFSNESMKLWFILADGEICISACFGLKAAYTCIYAFVNVYENGGCANDGTRRQLTIKISDGDTTKQSDYAFMDFGC